MLFAAVLLARSADLFAQTATPACPGYVQGSTPYNLRDVLAAFCIAAPTRPLFDLDASVQYGAFNGPKEFVLAYNLVSKSNLIEPPLRVLRLDKQKGTWTSAELGQPQAEILPGLTNQCMGSAGGVEKFGSLFFVDVELSPSAVCVPVITEDLKLKTVLSGIIEGGFSNGVVVLSASNIHFAPTHPLRVLVFDPRRGTPVEIYPPHPDPLRDAYIQRLRTEIPESERCQGATCEGDFERFDNDLGVMSVSDRPRPALTINNETQSLAFLVRFMPTGFVSFDEVKTSPPRDEVVYVYRLNEGPIAHREFRSSEMKSRYGVTSLDDLLTAKILTRLFEE